MCPSTNGTAIIVPGVGCGNPTIVIDHVYNDTMYYYEEYAVEINFTNGYMISHLTFSRPIQMADVDVTVGVIKTFFKYIVQNANF